MSSSFPFSAKPAAKIPTTIVTGFLGAGKTTLIRHLLRHAGGKRLALIVNEFGELGFDGELMRACGDSACREEDVVELTNGCICCTVADDFLPTMRQLLGRAEPPDHIVIETSGLALPKPLVQAFDWPEVRTRVTVDGVVAVVDADAVLTGRFATDPDVLAAQRAADPNLDHDSPLEELFEDQLACADLVILTKTDLLPAEDAATARATVAAQLRAGVRILTTQFGALPAEVLLGIGAAVEDHIGERPSHHDDESPHDHDDFDSFWVDIPASASPADLVERLSGVALRHDILRLKGFAAITGKAMRLVVQGVGARFSHYYEGEWPADAAPRGRLVVIGLKGLDRDAIRAELAAA